MVQLRLAFPSYIMTTLKSTTKEKHTNDNYNHTDHNKRKTYNHHTELCQSKKNHYQDTRQALSQFFQISHHILKSCKFLFHISEGKKRWVISITSCRTLKNTIPFCAHPIMTTILLWSSKAAFAASNGHTTNSNHFSCIDPCHIWPFKLLLDIYSPSLVMILNIVIII
jgi:hypothetical protein